MIKHIKKWNKWRKYNTNSKLHKLFVLFKIVRSPSFIDPNMTKRIAEEFLKGMNSIYSETSQIGGVVKIEDIHGGIKFTIDKSK